MRLNFIGGVVVVLRRGRAHRRAKRRCSPSTRPSRRWWFGSAIRCGSSRARPAISSRRSSTTSSPSTSASSISKRRRRKSSRPTRSGSWSMPSPATKSTIRCGSIRRSVRSGRQFAARDPAQFGAAPRARRSDLHPGRARSARRPDGAHPRAGRPRSQAYGIEVVDVRIRRADLPEQNSQAVYQRMQTERQREAAEFRAQGSQRSQEIRAAPIAT